MPAVDDSDLRQLAFAAAAGDPGSLARVIDAVRDRVYRLALRMRWHPEDAEDATQEALIRIMTRIGSYRGDAAFETWAYRVAANHILNWRQSRAEQEHLTFRRFGEQLHEGLGEAEAAGPEAQLLVEEVKLGCTLGMLLCLDREHRLAYVLSDVFQLPSADEGFICGTTPAAFRKRASRARVQLRQFVADNCGLVNRAAACRCSRLVEIADSARSCPPGRPHLRARRGRGRRDGSVARPRVADAKPSRLRGSGVDDASGKGDRRLRSVHDVRSRARGHGWTVTMFWSGAPGHAGAVEEYPFGDDVTVFKVAGKMFALVLLDDPGRLKLKCDSDWALALRVLHSAVTPGYHANKRHWNTVLPDGSVDTDDLREMIDHSYELVVASLPGRVRDDLNV